MSGMDRQIEKKNRISRKQMGYIAVGAMLIVVLSIIIFGDKSSKLNIERSRVSVDMVSMDVFQDYITEQGIVEPIKTIYLDAVEGGRVEEIIIEEGSMVRKDDVILRLSNNTLLLEITNNEAQVTRAVNDLRTARLSMDQQKLSNQQQIIELNRVVAREKRSYESNLLLIEDQLVSEEEFEVSKESFEASSAKLKLLLENYKNDSLYRSIQINSLEASVNSMEASVEIIKERLENLNIKAPVDGQLATLTPEIGQVITYGNRVGTINILDAYKLRVEIDEHYISRIIKGLTGECDFANEVFQAEIVKVYPEVQGGRFAVDMVFTKEIPKQIRIGQTSKIRLQLGESKKGLLLPKGSFYNKTGGQWVFVLDPSEEFALKREISIGRQNPRYYEVLSGLKEGEQVITSSYKNFVDHDMLIFK